MKRLSMIVMSLLTIMSTSLSVKSQEVTITLSPGWNWVSYPRADIMDVNTAFQSIPPTEGDVIKTQDSYSEYINGSWYGSLQQLIPGKGLKYYSMKTGEVSFIFGAEPSNPGTVPTGALNGKFTINDIGDQVYFSQGNLQYIGSASTPYWKFADHQWDYLGNNGQSGTSQNIDRDLFPWGTSGYDHGANCYQPYSNGNYYDYYAYANPNKNLYDEDGRADWGYNPIYNGGDQENRWRTLTIEEWTYLCNTRYTPSGIRIATARVNDVDGLILLPDNWDSSTYPLSHTNNLNGGYIYNVISISGWETYFATQGAVFLPAAGYKKASSINTGNAYYWLSSARSEVYYAQYIHFGPGTTQLSRNHGLSVRLVCDVE